MGESPALRIENLSISYRVQRGLVRAVRDVSLTIHRGEAYGLVGETGCGKSTLAYAVMRYLGTNGQLDRGRIFLYGEDLARKSDAEMQPIRGARLAMVYQDPATALNPSLRVGFQIAEVAETHLGLSRAAAHQRALEMLERVRMPDPQAVAERFPHQLSGGMQQRAVIAMALVTRPQVLIMDEPTTALDVTVQAVVLDLIRELRREFDSAILYITHNLGVIASICDRVGVMYAGQLVEEASVADFFAYPRHPYSRGLLNCLPRLDTSKDTHQMIPIPGHPPASTDPATGCSFALRCSFANEECQTILPALVEATAGHLTRCPRWKILTKGQEPAGTKLMPCRPTGTETTIPVASQRPEGLLEVRDLKHYFATTRGRSLFQFRRAARWVRAVDGVTLCLPPHTTLGLVGESGCGKSTLAQCIIGLLQPSAGQLFFDGKNITTTVRKRDRGTIRKLQIIFQNPDASLNPRYTVGYAVERPLVLFRGLKGRELRAEVIRLLQVVNLNETYVHRYPAQLSGGEKQRVAIARAFAGMPSTVICDEPISSLDVSVQATVINLLLQLQAEHGTSYLFISHDLSVVRYLADLVAVMYLGQIVEVAQTEELFRPPYHPYTETLLAAVPIPDPAFHQPRLRLRGTVPSAIDPPSGCRFHTRCPRKLGDICEREAPPQQGSPNAKLIYCHITWDELSRMEPVI